MNKIRFYSLVPHLNGLEGHQYIYHKCVEKALQHFDVDFQALIPKKTTINEWTKFFKAQKWRFFDFCKLFRTKQKEPRIFFLESFNTTDLFFLLLASLLFAKKTDRVWLLLRYGPQQMRKSYRFLLKIFKKAKFFTDSELIASSFGAFLKRPVSLLPIPHTDEIKEKPPFGKLTCLWPGEPRLSKGLHEIQKLAQNLDPDFRLLTAKHPLLENTTIEFIERGLNRADYLQTIQSCDILLLPYDPNVYKESTSGILVEAIICGKMPLVKKGSWLAFELAKHNLQELIVDFENPAFFSHLKILHSDPNIRHKLKLMQKSYKEFHSLNGFSQKMHHFLKM